MAVMVTVSPESNELINDNYWQIKKEPLSPMILALNGSFYSSYRFLVLSVFLLIQILLLPHLLSPLLSF